MEAPKRRYNVRGNKDEAPGVVTLRFSSEGENPPFVAGQFITVYFPELCVPEGKAYSISSVPGDTELSITVKALGQFSRRLCAMRGGDSFLGSDPYGFFFSEEKETPLVMLAVGIGITPFRSLITHSLAENPKRNILLCYGSRTAGDIVFKKELDELMARFESVRVRHFLSRETEVGADMEKGRMTVPKILPLVKESEKAEFMLCGSISFVRDMWQGLRDAGIAEERIYTEAFFTN